MSRRARTYQDATSAKRFAYVPMPADEDDTCPECDGTGEGSYEQACAGCRGSGCITNHDPDDFIEPDKDD
jgi:DnaJ-class molecular chaperone